MSMRLNEKQLKKSKENAMYLAREVFEKALVLFEHLQGHQNVYEHSFNVSEKYLEKEKDLELLLGQIGYSKRRYNEIRDQLYSLGTNLSDFPNQLNYLEIQN